MGLLDKLKGLKTEGASILIDSIGKAADSIFTNKEEVAEAQSRFAEIVKQHEERMADIEFKEYEATLKDIQSARDANVKLQESDKASWWAKNTAYFLDIFIGSVWGAMTIFIVAKALKLVDNVQADMTAVLSMYSTVTAVFMISVNFHRGTSIGSKENGKRIDKMINKM